jgi:ubiquinone/menaquinone biosynthesis C-methylase UbiE
LYEESAFYYDIIYGYKNYEKESEKLHRIIERFKKSRQNFLLDVACGTGDHIAYLKKHYKVRGLDNNPRMLRQARKKHPDVGFHVGDMTRFNLRTRFDVVTCLFSAIGHVKTKTRLRQAVRNMAHHLNPGGLLIVEPWLTPDKIEVGRIIANFVDKPRLKIARMGIGERRGNLFVQDLHHLIASAAGVKYFVEHLELGLFTHQQYLDAFRDSKLHVIYDPKGLTGRGLYLGVMPIE